MVEMITITTLSSESIVQAAVLALCGFILAMFATPVYTSLAYGYKWWKRPRVSAMTGERAKEFTKLHGEKHRRNIPTMAGLIMLVSVALITLTLNFSRSQTLLPLVATVGAGLVGLADDLINLRDKGGTAGLHSRVKFLLVTLVALLGGLYFAFKLGYDSVAIPFIGPELIIGPIGIVLLFMLVVVSTANAVNITDGLDGLAGGLLTSAFAAYTLIALLQGNLGIAGFCATIVGVLLAYTWFNIYPARFFMGDVGSFALGAALGVVAMLTSTVVILPIIAGIFVLEAGSSLLQIMSKKFLNKKLFRVAPLHHHFEAMGWPETKVTMRFWILGQVAGVVGVVVALLGGMT